MSRRNARGRDRGHAPVPVVKFTTLNLEYVQLGGTTFTGSEGIIKAQRWLRNVEKIFTRLEITDAQNRQLAAWKLENAARDWWESVTADTIETDITWLQFR